MRILFDCTPETMYPLAAGGFSGGSQVYAKAIIRGLAARGHTVHVIARDLKVDEQRGEREFWWPPEYHPHLFDVAVMQMHLRPDPDYDAPILILMTSCIDPQLGPDNAWATGVDAVPVFSETHRELLCKTRSIPPEKCYVTGLGVDLDDYDHEFWDSPSPVRRPVTYHIPGRMLYGNDPARGLFYTLDIFDLVKKQIPEATLHVTYAFDLQFAMRAWEHSAMAEMLWDCKRRLETTPGVVKLGADITRGDVIREQLECQVHVMPSDPPGVGTQTHGIMQMECAAAGCALVLSDVEAFPEVFTAGATIMPVIGKYEPTWERRCTAEDYAMVVATLMRSPELWAIESRKARALAEANTWGHVIQRWEDMLTKLAENVKGVMV